MDFLDINGSDRDFPSLEEATDFAMNNWTEKFVMIGIQYNDETFEVFRRRPTFFLIDIRASTMTRFKRLRKSNDLEGFVSTSDSITASTYYHNIMSLVKATICNDSTIENLLKVLLGLDLNHRAWIRPEWDSYFMRLAELASSRSNCMKRRVGAVIVKDCKVISTGYNGTARGLPNCSEGGCPRCNRNAKCGQSLDDCICLHAEENALLEAGTPRVQGGTIYSTSTPCLGCAKRIVQTGIKRVVYEREYSLEHNVQVIFEAAGVKLEKISPPRQHQFYVCSLHK